MEKALETRSWIVGDDYSIADICIFPVLHRMTELSMEAMWQADMPRVVGWYRRMTERPSFAKAFYPEAKLAFSMPQLREVRAGFAAAGD